MQSCMWSTEENQAVETSSKNKPLSQMFSESLSWVFGPLTLVFGLRKIRLSAVKIEPWSKRRCTLEQPRRLGYEDATVWLIVPGWRCLIFQFLSQGCAPRGPQSMTAWHYRPILCGATFEPVRRRLLAVQTLRDTGEQWTFSGFLQTISVQISSNRRM